MNKFEDYKYAYNIIKPLDLESINITKTMYEEILNILDNDEDIQIKYMISKPEDLCDGIKLNFYFLLIKYILKDSYFIYRINYLLKLKTNIIKNLDGFSSDNIKKFDKENLKKLNELLEIAFDLKYYISKNKKIIDEPSIQCYPSTNTNINKNNITDGKKNDTLNQVKKIYTSK